MESVHFDGGRLWRLKPYRNFSGRDLHSKALQDVYWAERKPISGAMMKAPGVHPVGSRQCRVQLSYAIATDHLKSRFSYIFRKSAGIVSSYTIGIWSHKIKPSVVQKYGTESDIARLPRTKRTFTQQRRRQVWKVAKAGAGKRAVIALVESDKEEGNGEREEEANLRTSS